MKCFWIAGWAESSGVFDRALEYSGLAACSVLRDSMQYFSPGDADYGKAASPPARRLVSEITQLGQPVLLAAWSLGGNLAIEAAALLPDQVRGLLLISSAARFTDAGYSGSADGEKSLLSFRKEFERAPDEALQTFYRMSSESVRRDFGYGAEVKRKYAPVLLSGLDYLLQADCTGRLRDSKIPVVSLHGTADRITPCPAELSSLFGRISIFKLDRTGHNVPEERPRELGMLARWFFDALNSGASVKPG